MSLRCASLIAPPAVAGSHERSALHGSAETASAGGIELALQKLTHYGSPLHRLQAVETLDGCEVTAILDV